MGTILEELMKYRTIIESSGPKPSIVYHSDWLVNVYFPNGHLWIWSTEMWSTHNEAINSGEGRDTDSDWEPTIKAAIEMSVENEEDKRGGFIQLEPNITGKMNLAHDIDAWCSMATDEEFRDAIHTAIL